MRHSSCLLFLGWWLCGQWQFSGEPLYPKPTISVVPGEVADFGNEVTILCKSENFSKAMFTLYAMKYYDPVIKKTELGQIYFRITKANYYTAGVYQCQYCLKSELAAYKLCSNYSEKAYLNVTEPVFTKPSIKVKPGESISEGGNITIECQGPEENVIFLLFKSNKLMASQKTEPGRNSTEFSRLGVRRDDAGPYTCRYHKASFPFVWSKPSEPVELIVTDNFLTIMLASLAAGLLLLVFLLLLLVKFILGRKKRPGGSTVDERTKPEAIYQEPNNEEEPDGMSYAVLNHHFLEIKQIADAEKTSESCTYALVAQERTKEHHPIFLDSSGISSYS